MKKKILVGVFVMIYMATWAQQTRTITGKVVDIETGSPLPGATVMVVGTQIGQITNTQGVFTNSFSGFQAA